VAALFGLAPRWTNASWAALMTFFLLGQLGPALALPAWATALSPFAHVPKLPGPAPAIAPIVGLLAVAAALTGAGLVGFRRRDVG
jgi:ABC-2 type transport system permease protein